MGALKSSLWSSMALILLSQNLLAADPNLFQGPGVLNLELKADFTYVKKVASEDEQGMEEVDRNQPKYYSKGTLKDLSNPQRVFSADVRARGMSNLWEGESEFPKLKVEIADSEKLEGSVFAGNRNFRINSHVATNPKEKYTPMGRFQGEKGPFREALAYDMARVLGLPSPGYRRARIHYFDDGSKKDFTRQALLLETDSKLAKRTQTKIVDANDFIEQEESKINPVLGATFFLYHAMIGNADVGLKIHERLSRFTPKYRPLFNTTVFERADGSRFPIVYDLDFSSIVRGLAEDEPTYTLPTFGLNDSATAEMATRILPLRHRFKESEMKAAIEILGSKKAELISMIQSADVDEEGRKHALARVESFYKTLSSVMKFDLIASEGIHFYADVKKKKEKLKLDQLSVDLEAHSTLRLGTPVKVLAKENGLLKVEIIDLEGDLEDGETSVGYIESTALIRSQFPDSLVGKVDERDLVQGF